ncbi:plasmid recombination protein [Treponema sp. R6D11]
MANMTVVRNNPHARADIKAMERHNERKNKAYSNCDVVLDHSDKNIYFKKCETSYLKKFDEMVKDGTISIRGQKANANIMAEMILDVNSKFFEDNGGYEFAKNFYEKAYEFAINQVGDEKYILSAVMHADERNKPLTDDLGHDVYHYHLHIVYIPIVKKEIFFSKRSKDKAGQLTEYLKMKRSVLLWRKMNQNLTFR